MTKYGIGPDVALRPAQDQAEMRDEHQILAPTLVRSQILSLLYQAVHRGEMTKKDATSNSPTSAGCGFACSATVSFKTSHGRSQTNSGWVDTFDAEYIALTQLQADALITLDDQLAQVVKDLVAVASIEALY